MDGPTSDAGSDVARARALVALHEALGEAERDVTLLLQTAAEQTARLLDAGCGLWVREGEVQALRAFHHPDPEAKSLMTDLLGGLRHEISSTIGPVLLAGHEVHLSGPQLTAALTGVHPAYQAYARERGSSGLSMVPMTSQGRHVGALGVTRDGDAPPFSPDELVFLRQVARVIAVSTANSLLLDEVSAAQHRSRLLAREDELTGLLNRRGFLAVLRERLLAPRGAQLVALLDMDGFRQVNDGFGHAAGDVVLTSLAARLCAALPPTTPVARLGSDEFAMLVEAEDEEAAAEVVERAAQALTGTIQVVALSVPLSVSVGTTVPGADADEALHQVELALHRAKRRGGVVAAYDPHLDDPATRRLKEVLELRREIEHDGLVVHYQPVVPVGDGPLRLEALVRRRVGDRLVAPNGWMQLADRAGLMPELTDSVVSQVVGQLARWWDDGLEVECAVNMPAAVLTPEVVATLIERLDRAGLPRRSLSVEVTESDLVTPSARAALTRCADAQIAVAVDDFGTGFSALSYLVDLPLRTLKIDRSFVDGIDNDPKRCAVVRALVAVAHELDLRVVAEGVETPAVADIVIDLGADALQGFLYGRPVDAAAAGVALRAGMRATHS